jgi:hypothetical protein
MKPELTKINDMYLQIEDVIHPSSVDSYLENLTKLGEDEFNERLKEAKPIIELAIEQFRKISATLTPREVIEGFTEGSRILRANFVGHMWMHFDYAFTPTIVSTLRENYDYEGAYLLLGTLAKNLPKEDVIPIVLEALDANSRRTIEAAIGIVDDLKILEAIPKLQYLTTKSNPPVSEFAVEVLAALQGNSS